MVEFNRQERTIRIKIAYYGPAVGGKTTNLKVLYDRARHGRRGEFVSVNSQQDRTILCDLLPLKSSGFMGYDLRFQLAAVPGQAIYAPARRVVLHGSDGVVFVANSATDRWQENQQAYRELQGHLLAQQLDPATIPMVMQYNKRDLPDVMELEALEKWLNVRRAPHFIAVATRGEGVLETLAEIIRQTLESLSRRYPAMALPDGQSLADWTQQAIVAMFGAPRLAGGESDERVGSVDLPEEALFGGRCRDPPPAQAGDARGGGARRSRCALERRAGRDLRAGVDRARRAGQRPARGARPRALAPRGAEAGARARRAAARRGRGRGPRPADPLDPDALGRGGQRQPAADHDGPAAGHGAAAARQRPARAHQLGWGAPRGAARPRRAAPRGGTRAPRARGCARLERAGVRVGGARAAALRGACAGARDPLLPAAHDPAARRDARARGLPGAHPRRAARGRGGARGQGERRQDASRLARLGGRDRVALDPAAGRQLAPRRGAARGRARPTAGSRRQRDRRGGHARRRGRRDASSLRDRDAHRRAARRRRSSAR